MSSNLTTRQLSLSDAQSVQECYDSQPLLMLAPKRADAPKYADVFHQLLASGCVAYGCFEDNRLLAFCVVWPWPDQPVATLVIFLNRPTGGIYNPERSGLRYAIDAALAHVEARGCWTIYYVRADAQRWKRSRIAKRLGRLGEYRIVPVERLSAGMLSKWPTINQRVLAGLPVPGDAIVVQGLRPYDEDF
jgi:hypothetical protein